ncbi:MAG: AI-2E family transporter [Gammaproteobacteria bacterium]|nr:AI-2E family transporter [Gammaproteobacteria bacterium]
MLTSQDRIEQIAQIAAVAVLVLGCMMVLRPFVTAMLWAAILCFSTWPAFLWVRGRLGGRHGLAALCMTLVLVSFLVVPLIALGATLADDVTVLVQNIRGLVSGGLPEPPAWLSGLPLVGETLNGYWKEFAESREKLAEFVQSNLLLARNSLLKGGLSIGEGIVQLSLSVFIAFFFFRDGETLVQTLRSGMDRIAGTRTEQLVAIVGDTTRSVVYGILGTAAVQGALAFIGFVVAQVPGAVFLSLLTFFLALVPMGVPLVWLPVTLWLFYQGAIGWGIFMGLWGIFVISGVDNVVRPYLISRGAKLSFLPVFLGVIGGVLAFGFIGIFLGPTLLAVGYSLLREWTTRAATAPGEAANDKVGPGTN